MIECMTKVKQSHCVADRSLQMVCGPETAAIVSKQFKI